MTSATLYHYTSSKEDLLVRIMIDGQQTLNETTERVLERATEPSDRLALLVGTLVGAHASNPLSTRVIDTEIRSLAPDSAGRCTVISLRDHYESLWADVLRDGAEGGTFTIDDPHVTRLALLTMCTGMSNWYRPEAGADLSELVAIFVDLALGAVRAKLGGAPIRADAVPNVALADFPRMLSEPPHRG